jgi:hypothetical protein
MKIKLSGWQVKWTSTRAQVDFCWGLANVVFLTVVVRLPNLALGYSPGVYPKRFLNVLYMFYIHIIIDFKCILKRLDITSFDVELTFSTLLIYILFNSYCFLKNLFLFLWTYLVSLLLTYVVDSR